MRRTRVSFCERFAGEEYAYLELDWLARVELA